MKKLLGVILLTALVAVIFLIPVSAAEDVAPNDTPQVKQILYTGSVSEIDATWQNDGSIDVHYLKPSTKGLKVKIIKIDTDGKEGMFYTYDLNNKGNWETYPLQMGNGKYTVKVLENISGTKYAVVQTQSIEIKLSSDFVPYLKATQLINYTDASKAIAKAKELTKDCKTDNDKLAAIYKYIVDTVVYDYDKANKVKAGELNGYVPVIDVILDGKKGICFDYSSLLAAMLRSQGIPTKLVMGYVAPNNLYHAWNEVYLSGQGWVKVNGSIYFDGKTYSRMDSTFSAGDTKGKNSTFVNTAKNYSKKYEY